MIMIRLPNDNDTDAYYMIRMPTNNDNYIDTVAY
jgi:hypothetical protein